MVQGGFAEEQGGGAAVADAPTVTTPENADTAVRQLRESIQAVMSRDPLQMLNGIDSNAVRQVQRDAINAHIERNGISARFLVDHVRDMWSYVFSHFNDELRPEVAAAAEAHIQPLIDAASTRAMQEVQGQVGGNERDTVLDRCTSAPANYLMWIRALVKRALMNFGGQEMPANIIFELSEGVSGMYGSGVRTFVSWGAASTRTGISRTQALVIDLPWIGRNLVAAQEGVDRQVILTRRKLFERAIILAIANKVIRR